MLDLAGRIRVGRRERVSEGAHEPVVCGDQFALAAFGQGHIEAVVDADSQGG
jgi:hypothetical protein